MRRGERVGFSLAGFGQNLVYNMVGLYLLVYLVEGVGLSSAGIVAATAILTAAKVWDAAVDLFIGVAVDRTRTRWGRFRPYLLWTAVPVAVLTTLLFAVPAAPEPVQLAWLAVGFIAFATAYTFGDVSYWAMTSAITTDADSRTRLIAWARTAGALAIAAMTLGGAPLARLLSGGPRTTAMGYTLMAALVGVVGMGLFAVGFFTTTERVAPPVEHVSVRGTLAAVAQNRPLLLLLASGALGLGRMVLAVGGPLIALVVYGDETIFTLLGGALLVAMVLATVAAPALLRRTGRKRAMVGSLAASAVVSLAMWLAGYASLPLTIALVFLTGLLGGVVSVAQTAMIGDATDDGEVRTGQRHEGVSFAGLTFVAAFTAALATFAFGLAVAAVGYTRGVTVTTGMRDGIWAVTTLLPAVSCGLSLLPFLGYRVPEADLPRLLAERRAAVSG